MGLFNYSANKDTAACGAWLLESFQRQPLNGTEVTSFGFSSSSKGAKETSAARDKYYKRLCGQIQRMLQTTNKTSEEGRGVEYMTRALNRVPSQLINYPVIQGQLLKSVPKEVMNFYWNLNQQAYFMKQIAMNNYLQIEPHRFLTNPSTELKQYCRSESPKSRTNNDASRRSRIKKKISTELTLESYECDKAEGQLLDQEEEQLHLIIAVLEDMVYEKTGNNASLINYYRGLSCLA